MVHHGSKYIVYDDNGYILIITTNKNIALHMMKNPKEG